MALFDLGGAMNPFKGRQSLGMADQENIVRQHKHKRAQSLGGDALSSQLLLNKGVRRASDETDTLSPRKKARRSLVCLSCKAYSGTSDQRIGAGPLNIKGFAWAKQSDWTSIY